MKASQLIKLEIICRAVARRDFHEIIIANFAGDNSEFHEGMSAAQVIDELKRSAHNLDLVFSELEYDDALQEMRYEVRCAGIETNLQPINWSRHYEIDAVALCIFGKWVAWDYFYGGGKHSEPEEIEWIEDARFINCEEKEVTVIQRTFSKVENAE